MVIPNPSDNEDISRQSYGAIPLNGVEDGQSLDEEEGGIEMGRKHRTISNASILDLGEGERIDEISIISNTVNALLGVSLFAMPWGFQQSGLIGGMLILTIIGYLSFDTARMLLIAQKYYYHRNGKVFNYPEIAASALGEIWANVVKIATIISCLGGCTGYLIFFGETVGQGLSIEPEVVIYISIIPLILLSWIRSFRELTVFTIFGVIALIIAVFAILLDGSRKMDHNWEKVPLFMPRTFVNFLGPATFLYTIHYFILSLGAENLQMRTAIALSDEDEESMGMTTAVSTSALIFPIGISYAVSMVIIIILGGMGFVMYRDVLLVTDAEGELLTGCEGHVCQNVILNLSPGLKRDIVGLTMSVVIILSYILILAPAREHLERMFLSWLQPSTPRYENMAQNGLRSALVLLTVSVALISPYSASMLGAVGGLTDALQCFVLPPMIFLKLQGSRLGSCYHIYYAVIVIWGLLTMLYTLSYAIASFLSVA